MSDDPDPSLAELVERICFVLQEPVDFRRTDTDTTLTKVRLLTAAAIYFNTLAVGDFGGRVGPLRARGLLEQAIGAAFQSYGDTDPHFKHDACASAHVLIQTSPILRDDELALDRHGLRYLLPDPVAVMP